MPLTFQFHKEPPEHPVLFSCYVSTIPEVINQTSDTTVSGYVDDHAFTQAFTQKDTLVKHTIEEKVDRIKKMDVDK